MSDATKAVFLSYASQDAEAATRICDALRAADVEVWFDQSELVGGDSWDAKIRGQIASCTLFVPVISAATQARGEGYFRLEWKLAVDRSHLIAHDQPFLLPVVIDTTSDAAARVPPEFRSVQWTRLPGGETSERFCARVKALLSSDAVEVAGRGRQPSPGYGSTSLPRQEHDVTPDSGVGLPRRSNAETGDPALQTKVGRRVPAAAWIGALLVVLALASYLALRTKPNAVSPTSPPTPTTEKSAGLSDARQLVAKAWVLMNKTELGRAELEAADELCKRAAALDSTDADVQAAWSQVDTWFVFHNFDDTPERREHARIKAARALQLTPVGYEARLAQACYHVRGLGDQIVPMDIGVTEDLLKGLLREKPDEPRALFALGTLQVNLGHLAEARATFGRLAENPAFAATAWNEIGWAEWGQADDYRAAEVAADRSIALQPYWGNLSLKSYLAWRWRGDLDVAITAHLRIPAVERDEDHGVSHACELYFLRREPANGLRLLDTVSRDWLRSNGYEGPKAIWAALAEEQLGRKDRAEVQWQAALKLIERRLADQADSDLLLGLKAYVLAALGRSADAENTMRLMRDDNSGAAKGQNNRAVIIYARLGQADKALALLEKDRRLTAAVARIDPRFDPLRALPRFQALQARLDADPRSSPTAKETTPKDAAETKVSEKSVAVLAFANLSDDKDNEYFSDGISEELLNVLAKIPELKVSARTSAFHFKGTNTAIPEIARQLGVAYVVEGSVRKQGTKVRITAQLIKAADGFHVWSDTFTRELKDIFAVQDEIAGLIAQNLQLKMGVTAAESRRTIDPAVYQEYLFGRAMVAAGTATSARDGIVHLREAVRLDPSLTAAWVQIARTYVHLSRWGGLLTTEEWADAHRATERAVALEPNLPDVWLALGWMRRTADWNWSGAEQALREALRLRPDHAETLAALGILLANLGREQEAVTLARRAAELDPLNAATQMDLLSIFYVNGRYQEAERAGRRAIELLPSGQITRSWLALSLIEQHRFEEAEAEARLEPEPFARQGAQIMLAIRRGHAAEARALLQDFEAKAKAVGGAANSYAYLALLWGHAGEQDKGFEAMLKTRDIRDPSIAWVRTAFFSTGLGTHPRWPEFLRSVGLADDQLK